MHGSGRPRKESEWALVGYFERLRASLTKRQEPVKRSKTTGHRTQETKCESFPSSSIEFRTQSAPPIAAISQAATTSFIRQFISVASVNLTPVRKDDSPDFGDNWVFCCPRRTN
jgi:hypothetical protein